MRTTPHTPTTNTNPNLSGANLARLGELDHCKVADGEPDIRGWTVHSSDGRQCGRVDDLIVDTEAMKVRYMDVELDRKGLDRHEDQHVLVPISNARLDERKDDVLLGTLTAGEVAGMPPYRHGQAYASTGPMPSDTDARNFYGKRGTGAVDRMTLSEEEMRVGTRTREAGEVDVHKRVETEHVSKKVPVSHEEVSIEHRPITGDTPRSARVGEDEVRIPLKAEEAVVEKRTVPKEEVVIRKKTVAGEQNVEADLKRERVDVDRRGDTADRKRRH